MPQQFAQMNYPAAYAPISQGIRNIGHDIGSTAQAVIDPIVARQRNNQQTQIAYAQIKDLFGDHAEEAGVDINSLAPQKDESVESYKQRLIPSMAAITDTLTDKGFDPKQFQLALSRGLPYEHYKGLVDQYKVQQFKKEATATPQPVPGLPPMGDATAGMPTVKNSGVAEQEGYGNANQRFLSSVPTESAMEQSVTPIGSPEDRRAKDVSGVSAFPQNLEAMQTTAMREAPPQAMDKPDRVYEDDANLASNMNIAGNKDVQAFLARKAEKDAAKVAATPGIKTGELPAAAMSEGLPPESVEPIATGRQKQATEDLNVRIQTENERHNKALEDIARSKPAAGEYTRGQNREQRLYDRLTKLGTDIDPAATVRTAMGVSKLGYDRAERLQSLFYQFPNLDRRQTEELAIGLNALLSGSNQGAQQQVHALVPQTLWGNAKKIIEWVTNNPTGLDQQNFTKRMGETIEREKQTFLKQIQRNQYARVAKYSDVESGLPEDFKKVLESNGMDYEDYQQWKNNGYQPIDAVITDETKPTVTDEDIINRYK